MLTPELKEKEKTCSDFFNCCDCGGNDCGCGYCWSCKACDNCKEDNVLKCELVGYIR